jgi:hypothetical protein
MESDATTEVTQNEPHKADQVAFRVSYKCVAGMNEVEMDRAYILLLEELLRAIGMREQ